MDEAAMTLLLCVGCGLAVWAVYRFGEWSDGRSATGRRGEWRHR